jgi:thymidine kinase
MESATITVISAVMGAGKTTGLLRYAETYGRHSTVLYLNSLTDVRSNTEEPSGWSSMISSGEFKKFNMVCRKVKRLDEVTDEEVKRYEVILIDEMQFFEDLVETSLKWVEKFSRTIIATGLLTDSERKPFGHSLELVGVCDNHIMLQDVLCEECLKKNIRKKAIFTKYIGSTKKEGQLKVGKSEYIGVCRSCMTT